MCYFLLKKPRVEIVTVDNIQYEIDTIYVENQTLLNEVNEGKINLNHVEKQFEKDYNCIVNESYDSDIVFFREYIEQQSKRGLFDLDYSKTIKAN